MRLRFQSARAMPQALHHALNRRGAFRVRAPRGIAIEARPADREEAPPVAATLLDFSTKGLSILLGKGEEEALAGSDTLHLSFVPPGDSLPLELVGLVRNRTGEDGRQRIGVEICPRSTDDHDAVRGRLGELVADRMAELLRRWNVFEDS